MSKTDKITPLDQHIINFIRTLRTDLHLSQADIARIINVRKGFVGNIESPKNRAKYNLTHINALAFYFDMSPRDFLPEEAIDPELFNADK